MHEFYFMATLAQIKTATWGIGLQGPGTVVTGLSCIRQRLDIAIRTTKGSDPCRPLFGSDVYKYVDAPVTAAIPNIKKAIIDAVALWVTDVRITSITHLLDVSHLTFLVTYEIKNTEITDSLLFGTGDGIITGSGVGLILQAVIPEGFAGGKYTVQMILAGDTALPERSETGYDTPLEMYNWAATNWGYLADFYLTAERLIAYIKDTTITSGSLEVAVTKLLRVAGALPYLTHGMAWNVTIYDGIGGMTEVSDYTSLPGTLLSLVTEQFGYMGAWRIEYSDGSFSTEFSAEFDVNGTLLVLYTSKYTDAHIQVDIVSTIEEGG